MSEEEPCSICLEVMEENKNNITELEECKHKFHSNCIVKWFRSQHPTCPECRGMPNTGLSTKDAMRRFQELKKVMRRKNPPKELVKAFKKLDRVKKRVATNRAKRKAIWADIKILKKHPKVKDFLKKVKQTSITHSFRDSDALEAAQYVIGATDYGTGLTTISSQPMQLVQRVEFNHAVLNQLGSMLP